MLKKRKLFFEKLKKLGILLVTERREPKKRNVKMQKLNTTDYKVMEKIMKNSKISRTDLAKYLELTPAAISKIIKKLLSYNLIIEKNTLFSTGGRPRVTLAINSNYKKIIGVNLGAGFINIVESNLNGEIIGITERKFAFKGQEKVLELLDEELTKALSKYDMKSVIGIGLATHGVVDRKKGTVIVSPHFKWRKLELRKELEKKYNLPVIVENDVRSMLIAEHNYGHAKDMKDFIFLYIKNGIGAAIFLNGKIFEGSNYGAGEIGHFIVNEHSNIQCRCGKYGCLETECSEQVLVNKVMWKLEEDEKKEMGKNLDISTVYSKAKEKEEPYYSIIKDAIYHTGKVMGNVLNMLDVNNIIVAGDITATGDLFVRNFKKGIDTMLLEEFNKKIKVSTTKLDNMIGVYGAVSLITSNLFEGEKLIKVK